MKKRIITLLLASVLVCGVTQAQYLGVKAGLNLSTLNIDDVEDENGRFGYHFGAFVYLPISDGFGIQPEVLYSTKGSLSEYNFQTLIGNARGEIDLNLNYIDIPIMAVVKLGSAFELHGGPYIAFLTNSKISTEGDFGDTEEDLDNDDFKSIDYGVGFGAAVNLKALQIGARYNIGLQDVQDSDRSELLLGDARNRYIQVFAAIRIGNYD